MCNRGTWENTHVSFGAMGDSWYEYLLKVWVQGGRIDEGDEEGEFLKRRSLESEDSQRAGLAGMSREHSLKEGMRLATKRDSADSPRSLRD